MLQFTRLQVEGFLMHLLTLRFFRHLFLEILQFGMLPVGSRIWGYQVFGLLQFLQFFTDVQTVVLRVNATVVGIFSLLQPIGPLSMVWPVFEYLRHLITTVS